MKFRSSTGEVQERVLPAGKENPLRFTVGATELEILHVGFVYDAADRFSRDRTPRPSTFFDFHRESSEDHEERSEIFVRVNSGPVSREVLVKTDSTVRALFDKLDILRVVIGKDTWV